VAGPPRSRIRELLRTFARPTEDLADTGGASPGFTISPDSHGVNFLIEKAALAELKLGRGSRDAYEHFIILRMLVEMECAQELPNGFEVSAADIARLGGEEAELLGLPPVYNGDFLTEVRGNTMSPSFSFVVKTKLGHHHEPWDRIGPFIVVGQDKTFRLTPPMLRALTAIESHGRLAPEDRTEMANVSLIAALQRANAEAEDDVTDGSGAPLAMNLKHFDRWTTEMPDSISIAVEQNRDGSLAVSPDLGVGIDPDKILARWHQIDRGESAGVIRVDKTLVLMDEKRTAAVREVLSNRRIPADQVKAFLEAPGAFFDASLVNLDVGFDIRVKGVGAFVPTEYDDAKFTKVNWFFGEGLLLQPSAVLAHVETLEQLEEISVRLSEAWERGQTALLLGDNIYDISDRERTEEIIREVRERVAGKVPDESGATPVESESKIAVGIILEDVEETSTSVLASASAATPRSPVDYTSLLRQPFPHQRSGIEWMVGLMQSSLDDETGSQPRIQGALLADDMGLGKTYMTLVAIREFLRVQLEAGLPDRPTLAVLPLTLIENWEEEIAQTFPVGPFKDIVVLQGDRDLARYRIQGAGRETRASSDGFGNGGMLREDAIKFSLRIGSAYGPDRLDMPGRLVLATYDAVRDYQLSLGQIDWGVIVFDEAQNIKVPTALRTHAAKGLKARFKLLATGTPIENSLLDLWCLIDTAQPGLLGSWSEFRTKWVVETEGEVLEESEFEALALRLRDFIGPFMLRRTKADHLPDLPSRTVHTGISATPADGVRFDPELAIVMPPSQLTAYDDRLHHYKSMPARTRAAALSTLQQLRAICLHPDIGTEGPASGAAPEESARVLGMFAVLDRIRLADEKAIIFVIDRRMQRKLAVWLRARYNLPVSVVNGETQAVSNHGGETRRSLIRDFEQAPGFNLIIMSPLAVGVGLTVVGANHAVLLERHWNPAKEAQATDRIYRIGQRKPVHIYIPVAFHPEVDSFDIHLDSLLRQKTRIKDAVIVPESITGGELAVTMGLL